MKVCAVASCRKDSTKCPGVTFFNLPRDPCAKSEWLDALGVKRSEVSSSIKVCEAHFRSKDFCAGKRQLKTHAVPVLHLGVKKTEPLDSDDEFMNCDSDNDDIIEEVKKITAAEAMMDRKIKREESEKKPQEEQEQETGRRPSRRAAREAAKKIYNTVRNYGCAADTDDSDVINAPKLTSPPKAATPRPAQRQRQRSYQNIKVPPPNIDLVMECHEELLSTVQAEALLQAQLQYNMVMKTLRCLKASSNVRIICQSADEPPSVQNSDDEDADSPNAKNESDDHSSNTKQTNGVTFQNAKKENGSIYPMELSANVPSPALSILS